ncbi:nucleotide exchange factor GrpE [Candidatus Saccharibacteria bacterium]|nr:nucleotide exchange factor GrpE [Candidatus Saccharibacteria bacterium]
MAKPKKQVELEEKLIDAIADLQRTRADFENFRRRSELDKATARSAGQTSAILKLLPVIDNIERAIGHMPADLKDNAWAQGVVGLAKNLDKSLEGLNLKRIDAKPGTAFNPDLHEAIQFDDSEGEHEVIAEELQSGYLLGETPIRHAMVKVTKK